MREDNKNDPDKNIFRNGEVLPVVEQFYTLQGEGYHTGKPAYFLRIGGCDVGCNWCDTKFAWEYNVHDLIAVNDILSSVRDSGANSVVVTGGEPLMWNLNILCEELHSVGCSTYLETSGAYEMSGKWDWICLSPKRNMRPIGNIGSLAGELKVIIHDSDDFGWAEECRKTVKNDCKLFLQPEWSSFDRVIDNIVDYIKEHQDWAISLQSHKYMRIP